MILAGYPIHEPDLPREQRIDAAEDRADQVACDVLREVGL